MKEELNKQSSAEQNTEIEVLEARKEDMSDTDWAHLKALRIELSEGRRSYWTDEASREELFDDLFPRGSSYTCIIRGKPDEDSDQEDRIVAMGKLVFDEPSKSGIVGNIIAHESLRGQGLGKQIMENIINVARERGLETLTLTSNPAREAAHGLYKSLGFKIVGEKQKYDGSGNPTYKTSLFELDLEDYCQNVKFSG